MKLGYARTPPNVPRSEINEQWRRLKKHGCEKIIREWRNNLTLRRRGVFLAIDGLSRGDVLVVTKLDRLTGSTSDLLAILRALTKKQAHLRSLAEPWTDTSKPKGRQLVELVGHLVAFEKEAQSVRAASGRAEAKKKGVRFGRKPKLTSLQLAELSDRIVKGTDNNSSLAATYNVSNAYISRLKSKIRRETEAELAGGSRDTKELR